MQTILHTAAEIFYNNSRNVCLGRMRSLL
jgi:hypothetical protein